MSTLELGTIVNFTKEFYSNPYMWVGTLEAGIPDASSGSDYYADQLRQVETEIEEISGVPCSDCAVFWLRYVIQDDKGNAVEIYSNHFGWELVPSESNPERIIPNNPERYKGNLFVSFEPIPRQHGDLETMQADYRKRMQS